jgi:hypothetical protein
LLEFGIHISQINQTLHPLDAAPTWFQTYAAAQKVAQTALTAQVTALTTAQTALTAQVTALVTAQTALTTEVATVKAQATTRHNELLNGLYNCNAISYNRSSNRPMSDLLPLKDTGGNIPENFPLTRENLFALSSADCQSLLTAYALPLGGNLDAKRKRLANHFGLP